jgi:hypothetical protein
VESIVKKWKVFLSIFVLLAAAGGGSLYYFLNVKEYKTEDKKVEEIVKSNYDIQLPGDENSSSKTTGETNNGAGKDLSLNQTGQKANAAVAANSGTSAAAIQKTSVVKAKKLTVAEIIGKYQSVFKQLEGQVDGKLNSLISYAYSEYQTKKANGEEISYFYFYSKYTGAANNLEASTDDSFYYIYNALVKELENSGYSAKEAEPIKSHYVSMKKQRRSALMNQAMTNIH